MFVAAILDGYRTVENEHAALMRMLVVCARRENAGDVCVYLDHCTIQAVYQQSEHNMRARGRKALEEEENVPVFSYDAILHGLLACASREHLHSRLRLMYSVIDVDESGGISFDELRLGFRKIASNANTCDFSIEEWEGFVSSNAEYLDENGQMGRESFIRAMEEQLRSYAKRKLSQYMSAVGEEEPGEEIVMYTLKVLLSEVESLQVQVSSNEAQRTLEAKVEQLGEKMDILLHSLNRGSPSVVSLNDAVTAAAAAPEATDNEVANRPQAPINAVDVSVSGVDDMSFRKLEKIEAESTDAMVAGGVGGRVERDTLMHTQEEQKMQTPPARLMPTSPASASDTPIASLGRQSPDREDTADGRERGEGYRQSLLLPATAETRGSTSQMFSLQALQEARAELELQLRERRHSAVPQSPHQLQWKQHPFHVLESGNGEEEQ